jgi:hypothetical protein
MKNHNYRFHLFIGWIYILLATVLFSCSSIYWTVPVEYIGQWETSKEKITVRTKLKHDPYRFISDSAIVKIKINDDKTVSGTIGLASFENAKLRKNGSLPWETGVEYIIECGSIGKIFNNDPLDQKEVEIWFGPLNSDGNSDSELRYTEGAAQFPMARLIFVKVKN